MQEKNNSGLFYCYSFRFAYFLKSQGLDYINKGRNKNNGLLYHVFEASKELDEAKRKWNELKENSTEKSKEE